MAKTFIVAELSANHGHKLETALESIREIKKTGADAVKLQTYTADTITLDCRNKDFVVSGKKGSFVTMVPKATNYEWDKLIWILYDKNYVMQEAWEWCVKDYQVAFEGIKRLSPNHYRKGKCLYKKEV